MLAQLITATAIVVLLIALIIVIIHLHLRGHNALSGRSPIPVWMLIAGKLSTAASIALMLLHALRECSELRCCGWDSTWRVTAVTFRSVTSR